VVVAVIAATAAVAEVVAGRRSPTLNAY